MKLRLRALLCAALLTVSASAANASTLYYSVAIDTSSLVGNALAPFALDFQLFGGDPVATTATASNFSFGAAQVAPSDPLAESFGLTTGNLSSAVTLTANSSNAFSEFFQGFVPGALLTFDLAVTTTPNQPTPDSFAVKLLFDDPSDDAADPANVGYFVEIPTTGLGNALLLFELNSANPVVQAFAGTGAFDDVSASAVAAVPEPGTMLLLSAGLVGAAVRRRSQRER